MTIVSQGKRCGEATKTKRSGAQAPLLFVFKTLYSAISTPRKKSQLRGEMYMPLTRSLTM